MRRRAFLGLAAGAGAGLAASGFRVAARGPRSHRLVERWSWAMGQPVHLVLWHPDESAGYEAAQAAFAELRRVEGALSRFDPASPLSELNRRAGRGSVPVGPDLARVLRAAEWCRQGTGGAFDLAVEPLMRAWGFREPRQAPPGERELAEARRALAAGRVVVSGDRASLMSREAALDTGGIGVGYGLDRAGEVLRAGGVTAALLDVSGDLLAIGAPPGEPGWAVDIVDPRRPGGVLATARIRDAALATSGNGTTVVALGRRTVGHVLDPRAGRPATRLSQATVVAPTGLLADALSTAMLVSGVPHPAVRRSWTVTAA